MSVGVPVQELLGWLLASVRMLALFTAAPLFGHLAVPPRVRMGLALVVALAIAPELSVDPQDLGAVQFAGLVASEALTGLAVGFLAQLIFAAFGLLGEFLSMQGGLGAARVLDPASGSSTVALAAGMQAFALLIYLSIGGHHALLRSAADSFELMPVGGGPPAVSVFARIGSLGSAVYDTAVRLALPVTVTMLVANVGLGLLGRAIPQLNLMMLQLPAHIAALLLLLALGARPLVDGISASLGPWSDEVAAVAGAP